MKWISTKEELPESGVTVNIYLENYKVASGFLGKDGTWRTDVLNGGAVPKGANIIVYNVTHWMPLPEPPIS